MNRPPENPALVTLELYLLFHVSLLCFIGDLLFSALLAFIGISDDGS